MMDAKQQVEGLMNELLDFAEKMLAEHGESHPFGGYLRDAMQMVHVGVDLGSDDASARDKVNALVCAFKEMTEEACAFGIVSNTGDAVQIFLEHREGYCADVFFRYTLAADHGVDITETISCLGVPIFFATRR